VRLLLAKIDAPYGVYATLGSPPVDVPDVAPLHFVDSHIRLLRGDVAEIDVGEGRTLTLIGMDCTHDMAYDQWKFGEVSRQRNGRNTTVLLYHSPELMPFVRTQEVDLFLCGHTHGGQVRLPFYGAILTSACTGKQYEMGRYDENGTTLYVSRGIGLEGLSAPRIRLLCPPEMTLVMLSGK
jgi:predicted MPP superfamily phosphohydrolase